MEYVVLPSKAMPHKTAEAMLAAVASAGISIRCRDEQEAATAVDYFSWVFGGEWVSTVCVDAGSVSVHKARRIDNGCVSKAR
jgi:hypothetical protein